MADRRYQGPYPSVNFSKQVNEVAEPSTTLVFSGELTGNKIGFPIGVAKGGGEVIDTWLSVGASGKDDGDTLSVALDVKINGTTCLTTSPAIAHVSGEASQQKTTKVTGDTGITQAVVDPDANDVSAGDVLTGSLTLTRTSPTTEIANLAVVVELEPSN